MPSRSRSAPGARGLARVPIIEAAIALRESAGARAFSVRKLADGLGCDPMAVLYHFGSRDGLERAMADWLTARLRGVDDEGPWRERLLTLADQYRALALAWPESFGLLQHYLSTGVADLSHIEQVYRALVDAGISDADLPATCLGWYSTVYGLAMAELGGLIRPATGPDIADLERLTETGFPLVRRLLPRFASIDAAAVARATLDCLHDGIAARALTTAR